MVGTKFDLRKNEETIEQLKQQGVEIVSKAQVILLFVVDAVFLFLVSCFFLYYIECTPLLLFFFFIYFVCQKYSLIQGDKLASEIGAFKYLESSALDQTNLQEVFEEAVKAVFADQKAKEDESSGGKKKGKNRDCVVQ